MGLRKRKLSQKWDGFFFGDGWTIGGGSTGLLVCWSAGLLVYWSAGLLVCWSTGLLVYWSAGLLVCWSAGLLDCWSAGLLVHWSAGLLVCWSTGLLVYWSAGLLVHWSTGLLVHWSNGLLVFWSPRWRMIRLCRGASSISSVSFTKETYGGEFPDLEQTCLVIFNHSCYLCLTDPFIHGLGVLQPEQR